MKNFIFSAERITKQGKKFVNEVREEFNYLTDVNQRVNSSACYPD